MKKTIDQLDKDYPPNRISENYENGRKKIEEQLNTFVENYKNDNQMLSARWQDIRNLVTHLDGRIHYWEGRRTQYLQLTTAILAASLAGIIAISNSALGATNVLDRFIFFAPIIASLLVLIFGSIMIIRLWNVQNNPSYPFTKGYKIWRWQYRGAENKPSNTDLSSYTKESFEREVNLFSENLYLYKSKYLSASLEDLLDQDLSQAYLCITNEKFKIKFVSDLRDKFYMILIIAFRIGLIFIFLPIIYYIFCK
ncbi:MAG: hypothetical protein LUQ20_04920 [Candidatus Methanoperedens sp.]|nr:hypothetical protein [Candidatus Methanoperedens sp.]